MANQLTFVTKTAKSYGEIVDPQEVLDKGNLNMAIPAQVALALGLEQCFTKQERTGTDGEKYMSYYHTTEQYNTIIAAWNNQ